MFFISRKLMSNGKGKISLIFLATVFNLIMIAFFVMTSIGLNDIFNVSLSGNEIEQIKVVLSSVVSTGILSIIFLQWIIYTLYRSLYQGRREINNSLKILGLSKMQMFSIYLKEFIVIQLLAFPLSITLSAYFYHIVSTKLGITTVKISIASILVSHIINFLICLMSLILTFNDEIRITQNPNKIVVIEKLNKKKIVNTIIFLLKLVALSFLILIIVQNQLFKVIPFIIILGIIFFYNTVLKMIYTLIRKISSPKFYSTIYMMEHNRRSILAISITIILGSMLFLGINSTIETTRNMAYNRAINNIKYESIKIYERTNDIQIDDSEGITEGLIYGGNKIGSNVVSIVGIKPNYIGEYEQLSTEWITAKQLKKNLGSNTWNGIILPYYYISENDIGKDIEFEIEGIKIPFVVEGAYYPNDFSAFNVYTSMGYINNYLQRDSVFNSIFEKGLNTINPIEKNAKIIKKGTICENSAKKILQSTSILEVTAFIILFSSFFMIFNFILISSNTNRLDIARMRYIGLTIKDIKKLYIFYYIIFTFLALLIGVISSYLMGIIGPTVILSTNEFSFILSYPYIKAIIISLIYIILIITSFNVSTQEAYKRYINILSTKINDN